MKIIDKDGRIFGKVNMLDLSALLLVVFIITVISVSMTCPHRSIVQIRRMPAPKEVTVEVILDRERDWLAQYVKAGDGQRDLENNYLAQVIKVEKAKISGREEAALITLKLKASVDMGGLLVFGGKTLRPGEDFILETRKYVVKGVVYRIVEE